MLALIPKSSETHASIAPATPQHSSRLTQPLALPPKLAKKPSGAPAALPKKTIQSPGAPAVAREWDEKVTVRSGDSLSVILNRLDLDHAVPALLRLGSGSKPLHRLHPGQVLHIQQDEQGLRRLMFQPTPFRETSYWRMPGKAYTVGHIDLPVEHKRRSVSGTIKRTLFESGDEAGLSHSLIQELAHIFGWDIDFALEIQKGDQFKLIWEERWAGGRHVEDGPILAAEFVNQGETYRALRYVRKDGQADYYTPDGQHLRKQFLRTPVDFARISSHFNPRRLHPILKRIRPHRGVDYAAPAGTPVYAAGDGTVTHRGWKSGYGRVIFIQHGARYTTVYAHLSKYAKGVKVGSKVAQGQIIGRVGQSGMATGPHLHYEFRIDGVHRNPVKVRFPSIKPLRQADLADFRRQAWPMLVALGTTYDLQAAYANAE